MFTKYKRKFRIIWRRHIGRKSINGNKESFDKTYSTITENNNNIIKTSKFNFQSSKATNCRLCSTSMFYTKKRRGRTILMRNQNRTNWYRSLSISLKTLFLNKHKIVGEEEKPNGEPNMRIWLITSVHYSPLLFIIL